MHGIKNKIQTCSFCQCIDFIVVHFVSGVEFVVVHFVQISTSQLFVLFRYFHSLFVCLFSAFSCIYIFPICFKCNDTGKICDDKIGHDKQCSKKGRCCKQ